LKVPPFLLSSCLLGVMAQRLVRRLCDQCKQPHQPTAEDFRRLGLENVPTKHQICKPVGCPACMETGYRGRMGIHELLKVDGDISSRIAREADARELRALAREKGMKSLMEDAAEKVLLGWTSLDEAVRTARAQ
jgi:type II secretory ATPase GspE/PulE/Tfp pilus assembly ATPase PilB-like protein